MHDIRAIRENAQAFDTGLQKRGLGPQSAGLLQLDETYRAKVTEAQVLQTRRNEASKEIGKAKAARDEDTAHIRRHHTIEVCKIIHVDRAAY